MLELFRKGLASPAFWALLLQAVVANLLPFGVQAWRLRRMDPARRERAWNGLTWAVAILALNAISMIPFEWVTRRERGAGPGALALVIGVGWGVLVFGATALASALIGWLLVGDSNFPG